MSNCRPCRHRLPVIVQWQYALAKDLLGFFKIDPVCCSKHDRSKKLSPLDQFQVSSFEYQPKFQFYFIVQGLIAPKSLNIMRQLYDKGCTF